MPDYRSPDDDWRNIAISLIDPISLSSGIKPRNGFVRDGNPTGRILQPVTLAFMPYIQHPCQTSL